MRVLCSTTVHQGHFGPLKILAQACQAARHEVRVAAPAASADDVARAGLRHLPFPDTPRDPCDAVFASLPPLMPHRSDPANAAVATEVFGRLDAQTALPGLRASVADWRPDIVLRDPMEFGSLAASEEAGVPHAEVAIGVAALSDWLGSHLAGPLADLGALVGLSGGHLLDARLRSPVFTLVPEAMDEAVPRSQPEARSRRVVRYRSTSDTGSGRLPPAWGDPDAPLVYVTFGTIAASFGRFTGLFGAVLAALAELPVRVLLTTGRSGAVPTEKVPRNAHVEEFWPQAQVMPHAAAVVGHGGFGTTIAALAAGVPQVVLPLFTTDQGLNAEAVAALGAGVGLTGGPEAVPDLVGAVVRVLDDNTVRTRAAEVAAQIAELPDGLGVVDEIGRLAERSG